MGRIQNLGRWKTAVLFVVLVSSASIFTSAEATGSKLQIPAHNKKSSRTKRKAQRRQEITSAFRRVKSSDTNVAAAVSVESLLLPRRVPLKALVKWMCLASVVWSIAKCQATAGLPHIKTIWGLIHGSDITMPNDYRPSLADIYLSRLIAGATNELIPPISLPSAGPLLGLFASVFVFIGSSYLLPRWFTAIKVLLDYRKIPVGSRGALDVLVNDASKAAVLVHIHDEHLRQQVLADPAKYGAGKSLVICPLQWSSIEAHSEPLSDESVVEEQGVFESYFSHPSQTFFNLNQGRFYVDVGTGKCIDGGPQLHSALFQDLQQLLQGGITAEQKKMASERYVPYNRPVLATPTVFEAFVARISSPLVVVQVLGRLLSCLEEGIQALITLVFAAVEHYFNADRAIGEARRMAQEVQANVQDSSSLKVLVLRRGNDDDKTQRWINATSGELVPGDVFVMLQESEKVLMPVDALLLAGRSLANEAVLTGESVPQSKTPIDFAESIAKDSESRLDMDADRNSVLFAGTTLIHCSSPADQTTIQGIQFPAHNQSSGVICLALRTGTYSSKGQLLRALKSGAHVGAVSNPQSERDAMRLILSLSVFAALSCGSLFLPRGDQVGQHVPTFRRIIQCTRIAIASIPSDLHLALSAVARSCSYRLRQDSDVICSEPAALLTAAYVDTVVFDKTGTLTADTQSVAKVIPQLSDHCIGVAKPFQLAHMAGCHSLIPLKGAKPGTESQLVGDPLDEAAFEYSGWKYNETARCYDAPCAENTTSTMNQTRLWQIKSFPFDPDKRISTALVVLEEGNGSHLRLLTLTKGSPDTMRDMYSRREEENFFGIYEKQRKDFEAKGYRSIAQGWKDLTGTDDMNRLFPDGLKVTEINKARERAETLHRNEFEVRSLEFGGFVQFDASIRPSSQRIIDELHEGGIRSIMLTGDAIDAAVTVASKVGLIRRRRVAILEVGSGGALQWRFVDLKDRQHGHSEAQSDKSVQTFSSSIQDVLRREKAGKCAIAATGAALDVVFESTGDLDTQQFADNLARVSVIARATPKQKNEVISRLKRCGRTVMMCGDGVNDVAAMKSADVAVALLNGFGDESDLCNDVDFDNERRRKKVESKAIGSQRQKTWSRGNPRSQESQERIQVKTEIALAEIRQRAAARCGTTPDSNDIKFELRDVKDLIVANIAILREERQRAKKLRAGGGEAARILAAERRTADSAMNDESEMVDSIKPGEASLVAPFSCLHPSIEGVDSVLRAGVATAASALATQELIALNSLMACYNLASLYRDGFRYGKNMSPVEMFMYLFLDQQRYRASCIPRPRLPPSKEFRPPRTMFQRSEIFRTVCQAAVQLISMSLGVGYARKLQGVSAPERKFRLELDGSQSKNLSKMLSALAASSGPAEDDDGDSVKAEGLFRRPPFRPNYETNAVFILSLLQNMLVSLANHRGKPFSLSILESRPLCTIALATLGLCVALIMETLPKLNAFLQLRPMPSKKSQGIFLLIVALNIAASHFVNRVFSDKNPPEKRESPSDDEQLAANLEERLLREESTQNLKTCMLALTIMGYLAFGVITKQ